MLDSWLCEPTMNTISHEKIRTTIVRMAVATVESVLRMPHLASTAVSPANSAEPNAYKIHMMRHLPFNWNGRAKFAATARPARLLL